MLTGIFKTLLIYFALSLFVYYFSMIFYFVGMTVGWIFYPITWLDIHLFDVSAFVYVFYGATGVMLGVKLVRTWFKT